MATTLTPGTGAEPDSRRPRRKAAARVGVTILVVGLVGLVVAARRGGRRAWSVIALVLGILMLVPALLILVP